MPASPEQAAWVERFVGVKPDPPAHAEAHKKRGHVQDGAGKTGAGSGLTYDSFNFLVMQLQTLADPRFQRSAPPALMLTGEKVVAAVLHDVEQVVAQWRDPKTLPTAVRLWRGAEPRLRGFMSEAQVHLQVDASQINDANKAIALLADFLSMQDVDQELEQATKAQPAPELAADLSGREMAKMEPGMRAWLAAVRSSGQYATPAAKKLEKRIELYFSAHGAQERVAAFKKAGEMPDTGSSEDLIVLLTDNGAQAATTMAKTFLEVAKHAHQAGEQGADKALEALGKWGERVETAARAGRMFFGAVNIALSVKTLVEGIKSGDWHKVTAGAFGIAGGAVSIAEGAGAITAEGSATAGTALIVAWATIDAVLSAAELAHWFHQKQEQDAFLALVADARKLVPMGRKLAAAADKMAETEMAMDSLGADNNQRYQEIAVKLAGQLVAATKTVIDRHLQSSSPNTVGGYPALVAMGRPAMAQGVAMMNGAQGNPSQISDGFHLIVQGIQKMTAAEAATNDV